MKNFILILLNVIYIPTANSQDSTISLSKFEVFSSQPGKMLKTEAKETGSAGAWKVTKFRTTDVAAGVNVEAIRISNSYHNEIGAITDPATVYIDMDELDSVINAFTYFINEESKQNPVINLQYSYITASDVEVFASYSKFYDSWSFGINKVYQKLRSTVASSLITFNKKRFTQVLNLLTEAKLATW